MSIRNALLANELAKVMLPSSHEALLADPTASAGESFRRVLGNIETCLAAHNKTNFTDVCAFNELIGNAFGAADVKAALRQLELIESEFHELKSAMLDYSKGEQSLRDGDYQPEEVYGIGGTANIIREIRDGIADVLVTTYGLAHRMGIDADKDMMAVSTSNASKFFQGTEDEAAKVCKALADSLAIKVESREAGMAADQCPDGEPTRYVWAFVSADDSDPERPRGKLLKAPGYKTPVFD